SVVGAALGWVSDNFPEARLRVVRQTGAGIAEPVPDHSLARLLARPNPFYSGRAFLSALAMSYAADGNAYAIKARGAGGAGRPLELWFVPPWQMKPVWKQDGSSFLDGYEYSVDNRKPLLRREDVLHFRNGIDRNNPRLGCSRLCPVLREVCAVNSAATMLAAVFRNRGVPSVVLSPATPDGMIGDD